MNNDKELIIKMAEFMGLKVSTDFSDCIQVIDGGSDYLYEPLTNGTQLNEFIEKVNMHVVYETTPEEWFAYIPYSMYIGTDKDRTTSIIKCVARLLGIDHE